MVKESKSGIDPKPTYNPEGGWEPSELDRLDRPPVEVFAAIEGQRKQLADYLRNDEPLSLYTIEAIAAWLAGDLPPSRPPGKPHGTPQERRFKTGGLALAEHIFKRRYEAAGRPRGEANQFADCVAEELGFTPAAFLDYRRRSSISRPKSPKLLPFLEEMWWEWKAQQ
ncbi:hypothetical protein ACFFUT_17940 [Pseudohalocynthiibacter aestuariivivens]|uniref:Uncharacterized protein n=1 Tax=Pseudohalocynthiibacter aestuariivivens TaxID=1591409 RepID=A0ABV5JLT9_9RHOB